MRPSCFFSPLCQIALHGLCIFPFAALSVPLAANEPFLKSSNQWTEAEALRVLNDSPWAHTITTTTQETPCDYEHPAFPGLFREGMAQIADLRYGIHSALSVCLRGGANSERSNSCRHESYSRGEGQQGVGNYHVFSQRRRRETADLASRREVRVPLHPQSESV
jgi:hypothetical protein